MRFATIFVLGCSLHLLFNGAASALTPKEERELFQQVGKIDGSLQEMTRALSRTSALVESTSAVANKTDGKISILMMLLGTSLTIVVGAVGWFYRKLVFLEHRMHADLALVSPASAKPKKGH